MTKIRIMALAAIAALLSMASCSKEVIPAGESVVSEVSLVAYSESVSKVSLDFDSTPNIKWSDNDVIAVFDGQSKNEFSVTAGSNTGASAEFTGKAAAGAALYAVYPFTAGNSLSGSNLSVTIPVNQVIGKGACVDTTAIVSVGKAEGGKIEFKQVCGLVKIVISDGGVRKVILGGNNLAGTATVSSDGTVGSVSAGADSIELTYEGGTNFPAGTYYAAVLPGTTAAGSFSLQLVGGGGLTWQKSASSAVSISRRQVIGAGDVTSEATFVRHITNKSELYAWGEVMGQESGVTVYLDADIDCASDPWIYTTAGFDGVFDGRNHKIYNIKATITDDSTDAACFIGSLYGTVKDLIIGSSNGMTWDGVSCFSNQYAGEETNSIFQVAPFAYLRGTAAVDGVLNFAVCEARHSGPAFSRIGGIAGQIVSGAAVSIDNCSNYGTIANYAKDGPGTATSSMMGGIFAKVNGTVACMMLENHGDIICNNSHNQGIGGICGDLSRGSSIAAAYNYGSITVSGDISKSYNAYVGGITGQIRAAILTECENYGPISFTQDRAGFVGGIVGMLESGTISFDTCINQAEGSISFESSKRSFVGGVIGGARSANVEDVTVSACKNHAAITNIKGASDIGGITGQIWTSNASAVNIVISNCENTGTISSTCAENAGGNTSNLNIGGIFGQLDPDANSIHTVTGCKNSGTISAAGALSQDRWVALGGIGGVGGKAITVKDCENAGAITLSWGGGALKQPLYAGGIMGNFSTSSAARYITLDSCVNRGEVTSDRGTKANYVGGIAGQTNTSGFGNVKDCVNYADLSVTSDVTATRVGGIIGKNHCQASGNCNYGSVSDGTALFAGAIAGDNAANMTACKVCTSVTVNGEASGAAGTNPDPIWLCPSNTGSIACTIVAHSSSE